MTMHPLKHPFLVAALAVCAAACGSTGQRPVSYALFGAGEAPVPFDAGAWRVTLSRADVGIGPIYLCATSGASSDLCPAAVQEFADAAVIPGIDAAPRALGLVTGTTGSIRSAAYDYAVTWFPTQARPTPTAVAPGGHSARFAGRAVRGAETLEFTADIGTAD